MKSGMVVRLSDKWCVLSDGIDWKICRRWKGNWKSVAFSAPTPSALLRCIREHESVVVDKDGEAALAAMPRRTRGLALRGLGDRQMEDSR